MCEGLLFDLSFCEVHAAGARRTLSRLRISWGECDVKE